MLAQHRRTAQIGAAAGRAVRPLRRRRVRGRRHRRRHRRSRRELADKLVAALAAPIYMDQIVADQRQYRHRARRRRTARPATNCSAMPRLALRAAKRGGRGSVRHFVPQIHEEHAERRFFLRELETAIAQQGVRRPLSAGRRRRRRRHGRRRSAVALESSDARRDRAVAVHSARRGKRPDDQARRDRVAPRARRRRALAEPVRFRQSVAGADAQPRARRSGRDDARRNRHGRAAPGARSHRRHSDRRSGRDPASSSKRCARLASRPRSTISAAAIRA